MDFSYLTGVYNETIVNSLFNAVQFFEQSFLAPSDLDCCYLTSVRALQVLLHYLLQPSYSGRREVLALGGLLFGAFSDYSCARMLRQWFM
jgi:hypothetical protein